RRPSSCSGSLKDRPAAIAQPLVWTHSGVAPQTNTLGCVSRVAVESFWAPSPCSPAAVNTEGQLAKIASRSASVRFGLREYLFQSNRPNPTGNFWIWNASAPSWDRSRFTFSRSPSIIAIIDTTVATPITIPSKVSSERSGFAQNVPKANRQLSQKARIAAYSYRSASTGSRFAARAAGQMPNSSPTMAPKDTPNATVNGSMAAPTGPTPD